MGQKPNLEWTAEIEAELLHLRNINRMNWKAIAGKMGRSRTAVHRHYLKITKAEDRVKSLKRTWTTEAEADVFRMRFTDKMSMYDIAFATGRTVQSVASKIERLTNAPRGRIQFERPHNKIIPQACLDDRNRRMMAERDLTAEFFGDPAPGQSALDRRLAEASA